AVAGGAARHHPGGPRLDRAGDRAARLCGGGAVRADPGAATGPERARRRPPHRRRHVYHQLRLRRDRSGRVRCDLGSHRRRLDRLSATRAMRRRDDGYRRVAPPLPRRASRGVAALNGSRMAPQSSQASPDMTARLMLVVLSLGWGVTWAAMRIALMEVPPFSMRVASMLIGATTLGLLTAVRRRSFALRTPRAGGHVIVASLFNLVAFSLLPPFAQLHAATSRVAIVVYTMPIWASLLARVVLGERVTAVRAVALALCIAGMLVLVYPLAAAGVPIGILLALGAAVSWAF